MANKKPYTQIIIPTTFQAIFKRIGSPPLRGRVGRGFGSVWEGFQVACVFLLSSHLFMDNI